MAKEYFSYNSKGDYIACTGGTNKPPCRVVRRAGSGSISAGAQGTITKNNTSGGSASANQRIVRISGTCDLNQIFHNWTADSTIIRNCLLSRNIGVANCKVERGLFSRSFTVTIDIFANSNHSDAQIKQWVDMCLTDNNFVNLVTYAQTISIAPPQQTQPIQTPPGNPNLPSYPNPNAAPPNPNGCDTSTFYGTLNCIFAPAANTYAKGATEVGIPVAATVAVVGVIAALLILKK